MTSNASSRNLLFVEARLNDIRCPLQDQIPSPPVSQPWATIREATLAGSYLYF